MKKLSGDWAYIAPLWPGTLLAEHKIAGKDLGKAHGQGMVSNHRTPDRLALPSFAVHRIPSAFILWKIRRQLASKPTFGEALANRKRSENHAHLRRHGEGPEPLGRAIFFL